MEGLELQPHIKLRPADGRPFAIVVGDPLRVAKIAKLADSSKELAWNREYRSCHIKKGDTEILVISHGVGAPGAAICFHELKQIGVKTIVRLGTAGSLRAEHVTGDILNVYAAAKEDGYTALNEPLGMPAVANPEICERLQQASTQLEIPVKRGIAVSSDMFYSALVKDPTLKMWKKCRVDAVEMETSALFTTCRLLGMSCGALLVVDGSPFQWTEGNFDPTGDVVGKSVEKAAHLLMTIAMFQS